MDISLISSIVTQTLIYASPLILTALGGVFSERSGSLTWVLKESWLWVLLARLFSILNLRHNLVWTPWLGMLVGGLVGVVFLAACGGNHQLPCRPYHQWYGDELDGTSFGRVLSQSDLQQRANG